MASTRRDDGALHSSWFKFEVGSSSRHTRGVEVLDKMVKGFSSEVTADDVSKALRSLPATVLDEIAEDADSPGMLSSKMNQ
eukprot:8017949-Karenia_brevis.AAC.1